MQTTWKPHEKHGELTAKGDLPDTVFAFPKQRKEPMTDAKHVRNAFARFDQVTDVSDEDRVLAFANIKKAAEHYDVELTETSWRDLGVHPQAHRKEAAAKAVETKRERGTDQIGRAPKPPRRASANSGTSGGCRASRLTTPFFASTGKRRRPTAPARGPAAPVPAAPDRSGLANRSSPPAL